MTEPGMHDGAQRRGYRFVITAKGKTDNPSAAFNRRPSKRIGRQVKRSCACSSESVSGNSIVVSFHRSPTGGNPMREESRGAITTIHLPVDERAKLTQLSPKAPLATSGRYSPRW